MKRLLMVFVFVIMFCSQAWGAYEKSGIVYYPTDGTSAAALLVGIEVKGTPCTMKFIHTSGVSTPYIFSSGVTFPEYVTIEFEYSAILVPNNNIDIKIYSPENVIAGDRQQIVDISNGGSISFDVTGTVSPYWTGAMGDGTTNDSPAWQAIIDSLPSSGGGVLVVPSPPEFFSFEDTVYIGEWNQIGDNIYGVKNTHQGLTIRGTLGSNTDSNIVIKYTGADQAGDGYDTISGVSGDWDLVNNDLPIFKVVGSNQIKFENLTLDGNDLAFAGIHFDQNCKWCTVYNVGIHNTRIGIRLGTKYAWGTVSAPYYGQGEDPYYIANYTDYPSNGGYDNPYLTAKNVYFRANRVGISQESSQALNTKLINCSFNCNGDQSGVVDANHEIWVYGGTIMIDGGGMATNKSSLDTGDARIKQYSGSLKLIIRDHHVEGECDTFFEQTSTSSQPIVNISNSDLGDEDLVFKSGAILNLKGVSDINKVSRAYNASGVSFVCTADASKISYIHLTDDSSSNSPSVFLDISNIDREGKTDSFFDSGKAFVGTVKNVIPVEGLDGKYEWTRFNYESASDSNSIWAYSGVTMTMGGIYYIKDFISSVPDETATTIFSVDASLANRSHFLDLDIAVRVGTLANTTARIDKILVAVTIDSSNNIYADIQSGATAQATDTATLTTAYSAVVNGTDVDIKLNQNNEALDTDAYVSIVGRLISMGTTATITDVYKPAH